ncbi:MAG: DUF547 domain-containing protein, partial [Chitinophagales bacterium]
ASFASCDNSPIAELSIFFNKANTFMSTYVANGKVNYKALVADPASLNALTEMIATADLSNADRNTRIAFYINAYNILTIKTVVANMPIKSPLDVPGFFDKKQHDVAGVKLTLNDIENSMLRPDARVHFVLVCAANGCPVIMNEAYMPDKVQNQLNVQTKKALSDPNFIRVDAASKSVAISQIFDWYKDDFIKDAGTVTSFINKFRTAPIPADYKVVTYDYDWNLNIK